MLLDAITDWGHVGVGPNGESAEWLEQTVEHAANAERVHIFDVATRRRKELRNRLKSETGRAR